MIMKEQKILFKIWDPLVFDWDSLTLTWDPLSLVCVGLGTYLPKFVNETLMICSVSWDNRIII